MTTQLTSKAVSDSLNAHAAAKGEELYEQYGPHLGWKELQKVLQDPTCVRYPCEIVFEAKDLLPGEMAHPVCNGERPEDGFKIHVHPVFTTHLDRVPYLVLYQLVVVNYGEFACAEDAEAFGAKALGLSQEEYYRGLCELADLVGADGVSPGCCSGQVGSI